MQGSVKFFDAKKGFGFITAEDGKDYFVHFSDIDMDGFKKLDEKQAVSFEIDDNDGRPKAVQVKPV